MKKEFTITMSFTVSAARSVSLEDISDYAEQLATDIKEHDDFHFRDDVEISEITVHDIEDNNYDDRMVDEDDE